jgi:hypothetical protein
MATGSVLNEEMSGALLAAIEAMRQTLCCRPDHAAVAAWTRAGWRLSQGGNGLKAVIEEGAGAVARVRVGPVRSNAFVPTAGGRP